jgi:hypothetical protein
MILYCAHNTSRLQYIIDFFSKELFDAPVLITTDRTEFDKTAGPKINYSATHDQDAFSIRPVALLFESGITPQPITCFLHNGRKAFFPTEGDLPFDIFSAAFYLLSRYEEYLPHTLDSYGRFAHTNSIAWREDFLDLPLVNYWLRDLRDALARKYPQLVFRYQDFKFIPTYDIDSAYAFLHKGWLRNLGGALRALITGQGKALHQRIATLRGKQQDPFDAYEWLDSLHLYCRLRPYYFFLVAARQKGVDKNLPTSSRAFQQLITYHANGYRLGIHPSWQSGDDEKSLREERQWLEIISGQTITRSRQHYIRFTLPQSYRRLITHGIDQDFSMGYGTVNGFRASVASSFYWYDLEEEKQTTLRLFPFCFMDANSYFEQGYNAGQAREELMRYYHHVRKVNGLMVTIWHNNFLGTDPMFAGWREAYRIFLAEEIYWYH